ncbi:MAG TPA: UDP-N-acetylglucosamine--N-acetylmuramyl-(pentapeptide) pyrophosphoryl-undecaprenol N-acetylglucosamine transferase [Candidatus Dormibacteraeota bacterium]|nr:UDP-N-acetylglucosamine--N-acetylmuramyl-(pentapeptide) pyrophosphoryl-undecaprenol N-acetylglucosamine transferase [Candidatus Dormibacteraeota bacterium]
MPALAVARAFATEEPDGELLLVGRTGGPEERLVPEAGFRLETVAIQGLNRDSLLKNLRLPALVPSAMRDGLRIVDRFKPDVVLGVGGYAMAPAVWAARRRGIPYVLAVFEPGGMANRFFRRGAAAACVSFADDRERFPTARTVLTGYPVRPGFTAHEPRVPPTRLLVVGGSQGARRINETVWSALDGLLERFEEVIHLTGEQGRVRSAEFARDRYRPLAFASEMPALMTEADLVICRAGVGTLAEVAATGLPAIVIPGTFGGAHQERNAARMVRVGAAIRLADDDLASDSLLEAIDSLDSDRLRQMATASAALGRPGAARDVITVLREVAA